MSLIAIENESSTSPHSVIFDLDETLIHTLVTKPDEARVLKTAEDLGIFTNPRYNNLKSRSIRLALDDPTTPRGTGVKFTLWAIKRPHLDEFLTFCFSYFKTVNIWTAAKQDYGEKITDYITRFSPHKFNVVFTAVEVEKKDKIDIKPIEKMIALHPEVGPIEHVFIVDDREDTMVENRDNGIIIPEYAPYADVNELQMEDEALIKLKYWFLRPEVIAAEDVRLLNKDFIFDYSPTEIRDAKSLEDIT